MGDPRHLVATSLSKIEDLFNDAEMRDDSVSAWSVGEQLHHALLAANKIMESLLASVPGERKESLNLRRKAILTMGKIPRGRGKAPEASRPSSRVTRNELDGLLAGARQKLKATKSADPDAWWDHFVFGVMRLDKSLQFVHIHTEHHLEIINDIKKSK